MPPGTPPAEPLPAKIRITGATPFVRGIPPWYDGYQGFEFEVIGRDDYLGSPTFLVKDHIDPHWKEGSVHLCDAEPIPSTSESLPNVWSITGFRGHGKDTFAKFLAETHSRYLVTHFADRLKEILVQHLGLTHAQVHGTKEEKETPFAAPIHLDLHVPLLSEVLGITLVKRGLLARTPREAMQFIGTEYVRFVQHDYWTDYLRKLIIQRGGYCIVADTRFSNELTMLRDLGARTLRIVRDGADHGGTHASEKDVPSLKVDAEFRFAEGQFDTMRAVAHGLGVSLKSPEPPLP